MHAFRALSSTIRSLLLTAFGGLLAAYLIAWLGPEIKPVYSPNDASNRQNLIIETAKRWEQSGDQVKFVVGDDIGQPPVHYSEQQVSNLPNGENIRLLRIDNNTGLEKQEDRLNLPKIPVQGYRLAN